MKHKDQKSQKAQPSNRRPRSLPMREWPAADQEVWARECRRGSLLKPGGRASRYAPESLKDFVGRYGAFLGFLERKGLIDRLAQAAARVTPTNVGLYLAELTERVSSVTAWNCIYKLRMAARILDAKADFSWLAEIEKDLALVMIPRSKFDRVVLSERLVEAGLTLVAEAEHYTDNPLRRARGIRNGLIIALLAACPIRIKNFAALEIGTTFKEVHGGWWITLPFGSTKMGGAEQLAVPEFLNHAIDLYLRQARAVLIDSRSPTNSLWISARTGKRYTRKNLGTLISKITLYTIGVDVSPHLFRTAAATTAATYAGDNPFLASAVLGQSDPRIAHENYIRASTAKAAKDYAAIVRQFYCS